MQAHGVALEVPLELLTERDISDYLDLEFPEHRFPREFGPWLAAKTEGNPLFLVDLLRYLVERKALVKGTHWELVRPIEDLSGEVPASVRALIERIFGLLSEDERRWLTVAAVQGETFDSLTLSQVAEVDELRLEEELESLNRVHRLVTPRGEKEFPDGALAVVHQFVHVLYQETLYGALTAKRKMLLHERIGEALERRYGGRTAQGAAELALHFDRARRPGRAVPFYLQAAENATSRFAHPQAEAYCARALVLAKSLPDAERDTLLLPIFLSRGSARFAMSRFADATADFDEMRQCAERLKDPDREAHALCLLAEGAFFTKQNDTLEERVEQVFEIADENRLPGRAAHARWLLGLQRVCYGRVDEGHRLLEKSDREAEAVGLDAVRVRARVWLTQVWFFRSEYERVLANSKRVEAMAIEHHDAFALLVNYFYTGLAQANFGRLHEGVTTLEYGSRTAEKNHDLFWLGRFPNCMGWVHHEAFDFERALQVNEEGVGIARETGFLEGEANSRLNVGLAAIELSELDRAEACFLEVEDVFRRDDWYKWRYRLRLESGWSELHLRRGDLAEATARARMGLELAERVGATKHLALSHRQLGRIALLEDRIPEAEKHLLKAVELTRDREAPLASWRAHLSLAELYEATSRREEAAASYKTALHILSYLAENAAEREKSSILGSKLVRDLRQRFVL